MFGQNEPVKNLDTEGFDFYEFYEKIQPLRRKNRLRLKILFEPLGENDYFFHKVMREGNAKICLLLLEKVFSEDLWPEENPLKPDFEGRNLLQIAIFRKNPLPPNVLFYFITKLFSFENMAAALNSNFEEDAIDYLPRKADFVVLQAVVDKCWLNFSLDDQDHRSWNKNQKTAQRFLSEIDRYYPCFSEQRRRARKLFVSLTPAAVNHNPEAFLSFFETIISDDFYGFMYRRQDEWLVHITLALNVVEKKEQYGDRLLALKIRFLYFYFLLSRLYRGAAESDPVDINNIIALILEIHSFENIDSANCVMMAEILSLTSSGASIEAEEKSNNFPKNNIFLRKRLQCLHAAVQKGRVEFIILLHGLLQKINSAKVNEVNVERWEKTDEERFQLVMAEGTVEQRRSQLKDQVSFKLYGISSAELFEGKVTIEENVFQKKESSESDERYKEDKKKGKKAVCHWKYHEKRKQFLHDPHTHESMSEGRDLRSFPVQVFPFDFEDFKKKNGDLADSAQQNLSTADSLEAMDEQYQKYCKEFDLLEREFLLKIKNLRNLKKILFYEEKILSPTIAEAVDEQGNANEEVKEEFKADFSIHHALSALQRELSAPCSRESLDQAVETYKKFQSQSTYQFLLKRGVQSTLEAEIARLKDDEGIVREGEHKTILEDRIRKIQYFLKHRLQEKNQSIMKKHLLDLSKEMKATTSFRRWANSYLPSFFKSQGEIILYNLATQLQNDYEEAKGIPSFCLNSS